MRHLLWIPTIAAVLCYVVAALYPLIHPYNGDEQ